MTVQCVMVAGNNRFMEFDGNALIAEIMTCAVFVTMAKNTC